ncbi:tRNA pseudouridine(38-40) synthase TruA [Crocinitomicaceae bacterium]|nr:tRNA pseudouridine(38-40) synthase TruA [Crocinitomicaceae bacterium]MDB3907699.1 tRNA pseudouridine(38-40) synthase TruA [Crocinitomicaceae bacterium]
MDSSADALQRYFIELCYDGTDYFGWQKQPKDISVQEVIESQLSKLHSNQPISVVGCGRTDTGVHAHHYILHVDIPMVKDLEKFRFKLNRMLPNSIAIQDVYPVSKDWHARFSATARIYRYFAHHQKDPFQSVTSLYFPQELDIQAMNSAAELLLGTQDFTSLSKLHTDVKTNICTVTKAEWINDGKQFYFEISADRFLRNMVRATVGILLEVGVGKIKPSEVKTILEAKDRGAAATSVPPQGLFLWKIEYDGLQKDK